MDAKIIFKNRNGNAPWTLPPLLVPISTKLGEEKKLRLTFDLMAMNAVTIPQS